jgi:hypothetical protein
MSWEVVGDLANVQAIIGAAGVFVGGVTTAAVQTYAPNTDILLESCRQELEDVRARLNEIPHERRERIRAAVEQGQCKSLEKLEQDLIKLVPSTNTSIHVLMDFIRPDFLMIDGTSTNVLTLPHSGNDVYR